MRGERGYQVNQALAAGSDWHKKRQRLASGSHRHQAPVRGEAVQPLTDLCSCCSPPIPSPRELLSLFLLNSSFSSLFLREEKESDPQNIFTEEGWFSPFPQSRSGLGVSKD